MNTIELFHSGSEAVTLESLPILADEETSVSHENYVLSAESLFSAASNQISFIFEIYDTSIIDLPKFIFHECIHENGVHAIGCINHISPSDEIPSKAEEVLCSFILSGNHTCDLNGKSLFFSQNSFPDDDARSIYRASIISGKSNAIINNEASILEKKKTEFSIIPSKIFSHLFYIEQYKYKFFEMYRLLESLFLQNILTEINDRFHMDPKGAMERATKAVGAERVLLSELIHSCDLCNYAREFNKLIESYAKFGNKFCLELKAKLSKDKSTKPIPDNSCWFGCWYIYQIRCSIAHAGTNGIVYEFFDDSDELMSEACDIMERLILRIYGIDF